MEHHVVKVPPDLIVDPRDTTLRHALRQAAALAAAWREERNQAHLFCAGPQIYVNFEKKGDYDRAWACLAHLYHQNPQLSVNSSLSY